MTRPTLTLLHGFMGDPSDWDSLRRRLSDFRIIVPTIRPAACWSQGVEQLLQELPTESVFVGYSMGARLLLSAALREPSRCQGIVFVSGNPGLESTDARTRRRLGDEQIATRIETEPRASFLDWWYTESTVFRSLTDRVRAEEIRRKLAQRGDDWADILRIYSVANQPNHWPHLEQLQVPFLGIAGMLDRKYANVTTRMASISGIETRIVPACGHIVHHEQPHVFLNIVEDFLTSNYST